jgi:hypothetical protein
MGLCGVESVPVTVIVPVALSMLCVASVGSPPQPEDAIHKAHSCARQRRGCGVWEGIWVDASR